MPRRSEVATIRLRHLVDVFDVAALEIGYESYPQLSRELKCYFGPSPSKTTALWAHTVDS